MCTIFPQALPYARMCYEEDADIFLANPANSQRQNPSTGEMEDLYLERISHAKECSKEITWGCFNIVEVKHGSCVKRGFTWNFWRSSYTLTTLQSTCWHDLILAAFADDLTIVVPPEIAARVYCRYAYLNYLYNKSQFSSQKCSF
jgi:hypothetical protein